MFMSILAMTCQESSQPYPHHALHTKSRGHHVAEEGGEGGVGGVVGEEVGMLPMGDAGQDDVLNVLHNRTELLTLCIVL